MIQIRSTARKWVSLETDNDQNKEGFSDPMRPSCKQTNENMVARGVAGDFVNKIKKFLFKKHFSLKPILTLSLENIKKWNILNCQILTVRITFSLTKLRPSVKIIGKVWATNGSNKFDNEQGQVLF